MEIHSFFRTVRNKGTKLKIFNYIYLFTVCMHVCSHVGTRTMVHVWKSEDNPYICIYVGYILRHCLKKQNNNNKTLQVSIPFYHMALRTELRSLGLVVRTLTTESSHSSITF